jgi:8-oxo-dGTP diphosphatase
MLPCERLRSAMLDGKGLQLVTVSSLPRSTRGDNAATGDVTLVHDGAMIEPGFDHHAIIAAAVQRLRAKLDWSMVAFALLPEEFTLFELQRVHEVILGHPILKPPFRKKMLERTFADGRRLARTGRLSRAGRHRPAELYCLEEDGDDEEG